MFPHVLRVSNGDGGNDWHFHISATAEKVAQREAPQFEKLNTAERASTCEDNEHYLGCPILADYLVFDEAKLCKLPAYLDWIGASIIPCAGVTAWTVLKDIYDVASTGGVSMFALKLARAAGLKTVNYSKTPEWHEEVLKLNDGAGVDLMIEVGGSTLLAKSIQVGYFSRQDPTELAELLPALIDRKVILRGINAGSKHDVDDLCDPLSATQMQFDDIIDSGYPLEKADVPIEFVWRGRQVGKLVIRL
ncbi:hypothetical protein BDV29DRAFT_191645 [Aspergillus leporis]|uniref:Alcohol dehydrogenase-like C-terminal domain-containing protein n=1 Tax=Aspergillus leporis TaxID=41062 RepID=A0A5N5WYK6_9EURO|nr:hypothetical protein BDV29DRAFT_191645 [Aspergillus leporis]